MTNLLRGLVVAVICLATAANARDWFVREGSSGDGSQAKPFGDPWQALDTCESGDVIHVAQGKYFGRLGTGQWEIPFDDLTVLGGYDADFKSRNPWKTPTLLLWDKASKNRPKQERLLSNKKNTVIDGVVIDQREQCRYQDAEQTGRSEDPPCDSAMRFALPATVRNCVVVNPGFDGIVVPVGSTVENNVVVNAVNWGIVVNSTMDKQAVATVKNNTVAFTFSFKEPGKGAYNGSGISVKGSANVTQNVIAFSDSNGIYLTANPERSSITNNVFFMNLFSNLKFFVEGRDVAIDDKELDSLDEVGLKSASGNVVKNPQLLVNARWMDAVSKRTSATPGKLVMDDFNKARQLLGLPMIAKGGTPPSGVAPAMNVDDALGLVAAKAAGNAGARVVPLTVSFSGVVSEGPARDYQVITAKQLVAKPDAFDGKPVELIVGVSSVANIGGIPSTYKKDDHAGAFLHQPDGDYERFTGFYKRGSSVDRAIEGAKGYWQGNGAPPKVYRVRGLAYLTTWTPKAALFIERFEEVEKASQQGERPVGRDWFVRAGASGGDGSKEKPFKDPFQALEKVEAGDFVHVAEGEYFGKLKGGTWKIDNANISLLGGYDAQFKERNPWKHPTRLFSPPEFKGRRGGYTIEGVDDHSGAVIDGFVFDKKTNNLYTPDGDLDYSRSDKSEHVWLAKSGCVIRNNVFLNGAEGALRAQSGQTIENNIFINHYSRTVTAERAFEGPFVFRNNTVLFAWELRFGEGNGRQGNLLRVGSQFKAVIDNNLFEFADNDAVVVNGDPADIEFTNNVFSHDLFSHLRMGGQNLSIDDKNWKQLADLKFKKASGNQLASAGVPLEQKWFDVYLNRTAYTPGKVQMDDWNQLRELLGQPVIATGGKAGTGMAPAYPWEKALLLFPKNPKVTAGARMKDLPVSFTGVTRTETSFEYQDTSWADSAKDRAAWDALDGKRVALKVVIRELDNQWPLAEAPKETFTAFTFTGPEGSESGGLPLRGYVKKGGKAERTVRQAKSYSSGPPEQWYVVKGVAKANRQLIVEVVERAD